MSKEFIGHVAFVTGGVGGIAKQICLDLAAGGASVVVADLQSKPTLDLAASLPTVDGQQHLGVKVDVSKKVEVDSAVAQVIKTYGRPADLIVNCAGIYGSTAAVEDLKEEDFDRMMDVNFKGTFLVTQAFGKALIEVNKPGSIVNISSVLAYMPLDQMSHYCASKAAVMQFTKVVAKEWGPKGIRINSVHPGLINTSLTNHLEGDPVWENYKEQSSLRRVGLPKDVSNVILFALSNRSAFVTGAQLEVSGQGVVSTHRPTK